MSLIGKQYGKGALNKKTDCTFSGFNYGIHYNIYNY